GGILVEAGTTGVSIYTSNISDNTAVGGGGIANLNSTLIVGQSTIANNSAFNVGVGDPFAYERFNDTYNVGGGIYLRGSGSDSSIHDSTISGNLSFFLGG